LSRKVKPVDLARLSPAAAAAPAAAPAPRRQFRLDGYDGAAQRPRVGKRFGPASRHIVDALQNNVGALKQTNGKK
jgi:hypothetical protein